MMFKFGECVGKKCKPNALSPFAAPFVIVFLFLILPILPILTYYSAFRRRDCRFLGNFSANCPFYSCITSDYSAYSDYSGEFCADAGYGKCGQFIEKTTADASVSKKHWAGL
jgi:hypothetical protein